MHKLPALIANCFGDGGVAVPKAIDRYAGDKIQISVAIAIDEPAAFSSVEDEIATAISIHEILAVCRGFSAHFVSSLNQVPIYQHLLFVMSLNLQVLSKSAYSFLKLSSALMRMARLAG